MEIEVAAAADPSLGLILVSFSFEEIISKMASGRFFDDCYCDQAGHLAGGLPNSSIRLLC